MLWTIAASVVAVLRCTKTAADLCRLTGIAKPHMSVCLDLLERVGAIGRVKRGRVKLITVTPEGAFRGNVHAWRDGQLSAGSREGGANRDRKRGWAGA